MRAASRASRSSSMRRSWREGRDASTAQGRAMEQVLSRHLFEGRHGETMRTVRATALIAVLSVVVAACGSTGPTTGPNGPAVTPAPSQDPVATAPASAAPAATPSPTPVDVAALTAATIADPEFSARVALDASKRVGAAKTTTTGSLAIDDRASHLVRRDKVGKTTTTTETVTGN